MGQRSDDDTDIDASGSGNDADSSVIDADSSGNDADSSVIDADSIASQRFSKAVRGYDRAEVGSYLHRVASAHRSLENQLANARAELLAVANRTSVVGVSPHLDSSTDGGLDLRELDVTDAATAARDEKLPGEDDEVFDRMVLDALERAVRTRLPHHR